MTDLNERYLACFDETDPEVRAELIVQTWSPTATYVDPLADVGGYDAITGLISAIHRQFPGCVFTPLGKMETHHDVARFRWALGPADGAAIAVGADVVRTGEDGRITSVVGFLDQLPADAAAA